MSGRSRLVACIGMASVSVGVLAASPPVGVTATIVGRERINATTSIGVSVLEELPTGRSIDQIIALLPAARPLTTGSAPEGWTVQQNGREINATGPARRDVHLRLDGEPGRLNDYTGKQATIRTGFGGLLDDPIRVTIGSLPKVSTATSIDGILTAPPEAAPGQPFLVGVANPYRSGHWLLNTAGGSIPLVPLEAIDQIQVLKPAQSAVYGSGATEGVVNFLLSHPAPRPFISAYPPTGSVIGARYTDAWGELLVDAPFTIGPATPSAGPRSLGSGSSLAIAGQSACVYGSFPDLTSSYGLLLDGKTELAVWGASPTMVMVGIPEGTAPGPHTIELPGRTSRISLNVLTVEGSLDQNKLWRGDATTMRLRVVGTTKQFSLSVVNGSPGIITIDGGVSQLVTTPGGSLNEITRSVRGIQRGTFTITYSIPYEVSAGGCRGGGG